MEGVQREGGWRYLLARVHVLGQLDLAHAAGANGLAQGPCAGGGRGDGGAALGGGREVGGYSVDGHCGGGGGVGRIPGVAASGRVAVGVVAAARGRVLGEVALLVVAAGDVVERGGLLRAAVHVGRRALGALGAMGPVDGPPRRGRGAHDGGRRWGCGRHGEVGERDARSSAGRPAWAASGDETCRRAVSTADQRPLPTRGRVTAAQRAQCRGQQTKRPPASTSAWLVSWPSPPSQTRLARPRL